MELDDTRVVCATHSTDNVLQQQTLMVTRQMR